MKNILSEEELNRYKDLMNYNSKKSQGLLSENKTFLFEAHGKQVITEEDRIRTLHNEAITIEEQKKKKRVYRKTDFGPFDVTYTKTPGYSKGYKESSSLDQYGGDTSQGTNLILGKFYQSVFGKKVQEYIKSKSVKDYQLIYNYMVNGKNFKPDQLENPRFYDVYIKRNYDIAKSGRLDKMGGKFRTIHEILKDEKIVRKKLIQSDWFDQQLIIWQEIQQKDPAYAADIITYVKYNDWVERVVLKRYDDSEVIPDEEIVKTTDPTEKQTDPTEKIEEPEESEGIPMMGADFGVEGSGKNNLYVDNCYKLDNNIKTKIDTEIVQPILDVLSNIPETVDNKKLVSKMMKGKIKFTWRGCVNSINFDSSASRFRNSKGQTCDASKLTFLQLSKLRAETVKNYIVKELIEKNKMAWCKGTPIINLNYAGSNGDGTSGPNPPNGFSYIAKGENPMSPSADPTKDVNNIGGKTVKRDECGAPHTNRKDYDQYKYTKINVDAAFNFELMEPEIPEKTEPVIDKTPEDKKETPGDEKVDPKIEVKSETLSYSADFYGEEEITEMKQKLKWRWTGFKRIKRKGMKGESYIGRKVKTVICNQPQ
jgi:hypothetical protein